MKIILGVVCKIYVLFVMVISSVSEAKQFSEKLQFDSQIRINGQNIKGTNQAIFATKNTSSLFSALDVSLEGEGLRFAATANVYKEGGTSETDFTISEAFYDFSTENWFLSVGKKKLDWDVAYGFRPLDMFSPTDSLAIYTAVPPGVLMITGDYFTESGNITVICNETKPDYLERGIKVAQSYGCGGRYYQFFDGYEAQAIAHYDDKLGFRIGGSTLTVIGDNLELHSSLLWQQNYRSPKVTQLYKNTLSAYDNVETIWRKGSLQALVGFNYSFSMGVTAIVEYWHDGRAPSDKQWRALIANANNEGVQDYQLELYQAHFATQNLFRDNVMVHLRTSNSTWQPSMTWLTNPQDNSMLINSELCYSGFKNGRLCLGYRSYAGGSETIYEQLSHQKTGYLSVEIKL